MNPLSQEPVPITQPGWYEPAALVRAAVETLEPNISAELLRQHAQALRDLWAHTPRLDTPIPTMDQIKWHQPFRFHPGPYQEWVVADICALLDQHWRSLASERPAALHIRVTHPDLLDPLSLLFLAGLHERGFHLKVDSCGPLPLEGQRFAPLAAIVQVVHPSDEDITRPAAPFLHQLSAWGDLSTQESRRYLMREVEQGRTGPPGSLPLQQVISAVRMYINGGYYGAARHQIKHALGLAHHITDAECVIDLHLLGFLTAFAERNVDNAHDHLTCLRHVQFEVTRAQQYKALYFRAMFELRLSPNGSHQQAMNFIERAKALAADEQDLLFLAFLENAHALALVRQGDMDGARHACQQALGLLTEIDRNPRVRIERATFKYNLAQIELSSGNLQAALSYMDEVEAIEGDLPFYQAERCRFLMTAGHFKEALQRAEVFVRTGVPTPQMLLNLAQCHLECGNTEQALITLRECQLRFPATPDAYLKMSCIYLQMGNPEAAHQIAEQGLRLSPDSTDLLANLGSALHELQRLPEAGAVLARAHALSPDCVEVVTTLSAVLYDLEQPAEALSVLTTYAAHHPHDETVQANIDFIHGSRGTAAAT